MTTFCSDCGGIVEVGAHTRLPDAEVRRCRCPKPGGVTSEPVAHAQDGLSEEQVRKLIREEVRKMLDGMKPELAREAQQEAVKQTRVRRSVEGRKHD